MKIDNQTQLALRGMIAVFLAELAAAGKKITYAGLAKKFGLDPKGLGDRRHVLIQMLVEIQKIDMAANRPSRTLVVINGKSGFAGKGCFNLLGISLGNDPKVVAQQEVAAAQFYYHQVLMCDGTPDDENAIPLGSQNTIYLPGYAADDIGSGAGRVLN